MQLTITFASFEIGIRQVLENNVISKIEKFFRCFLKRGFYKKNFILSILLLK